MIKKIISTLLLFVSIDMVFAQSTNVSFNGLGRLYLADNYLKGNIVDKDSISPNRGTGGYILFDLGLNIHASEMLKVTSILRARNEFGGFFGDGASLDFRQFKMEGIFGNNRKGLKYEIGDLDLKMTEYTLFNFDEMYNNYEAESFKLRRDITSYENFNIGNNWRLQGIQLNTGLEFDRILKSTSIRGFVVRTRGSQTFQFPDRILGGADIDIVQSKYFEIGGNYAHFSDLSQTVQNPTYLYNNSVLSGDMKISASINALKMQLMAEGGNSKFSYTDSFADQASALQDMFYDVKLKTEIKPLNLKAIIGYRAIGANFRSVGAQTRRTMDYEQPEIFGLVNESSSIRIPTEYDRITQPGIYNRDLSPILMNYNPKYNLVTPFGNATPNRKGIMVNIALADDKKIVKGDLTAESLEEIIGEGTTGKRKFMSVRGGTLIEIGKLFNFKKQILLSLGGKYESSKRDVLVNFSNQMIDAGLEVELLRKVFIIGGYKNIQSSGKEYISRYNEFGVIDNYQLFNASLFNGNSKEGIVISGFKYQFNVNTYFTAQYFISSNINVDNAAMNYNMNQIFFGYTLKF